jgi:hypothetical protein
MSEMSLETPPAPPVAPAEPPAPQWQGEFDPDRAARLVQNLRAELEQARSQPRLTPEQQRALDDYNALVEASQSDLERAQAEANRFRETAEQTTARLAQYEAAREHGIPLEHMDLLGSGTAEEVAARADKVKALIAGQAPATPPTVSAPGARPVSQLRPGATPTQLPNEEAADYERLFGAQA